MYTEYIGNKTLGYFDRPDDGAYKQAMNCLGEAEAMVLMGDNHKGYGMPVGGVAIYRDKICPAGVGFDIACGNKAVKTNLTAFSFTRAVCKEAAREIRNTLSFGVGRKNKNPIDHPLFSNPLWDSLDIYAGGEIKDMAQAQLGTIGSGNHYVDVFMGDDGYVWVGVHFGSRGLGHKTASYYMQKAGDNVNIQDETPHVLDVYSNLGGEYIAAMNLCGEYAYAGRDWVCSEVARILGAQITDEVHNHHNFAWPETHFGENFWVVRKGATPAFPEQRGFVGSTMLDNSVILKGVDSDESVNAFYSTVHGAGRVMSRTEAAGKSKWIKGKQIRIGKGKVDWSEVEQEAVSRGVILCGGGADEAPQVYKRLPEVLGHHAPTIEILTTLRPLIVCMAGSDEYDPFKD